MPKQSGFKGGLLVLGTLALSGVGFSPANAQTKTGQSLLGVRLYDSYTIVLKKFGPPAEVRQGGEVYAPNTVAKSQNSLGGGGGGGKMGAMGGDGGGIPGGPPASMMGGMMGARMPGGMSGGGGGGIPGGPPASMMGAMMGARMPAGVMPGMSGGGGAPGMAGLPGFGGARGAGATGGAATGGTGANAQAQDDSGEAYWWYTITKLDPKNRDRKVVTHVGFLFNKSGKVIQIQEYGYAGGQPTQKGIALGDPLVRLLRVYGWSNDGEQSAGIQAFRYELPAKQTLSFQLVKDQVVGITLGVSSKAATPAPAGEANSNGENQ